jgi:hypothetical protein
VAQVKVDTGSLVTSSWEFFSKNISKLWQVALLLALPGVISPFLSNPDPVINKEDLSGVTDLSGFTEAAFGVSVATAGFFLLVWLVISIVYTAVVYGGSISAVLAGVRGHLTGLTFSGVWNAGWKKFGSVILLGIVAGITIGIGFILLIIPGLIAAFLLSFSPFFLIDKGQGVSASMSSSYNLVKNNVGTVFVVGLVLFLISFGVSLVAGLVLSSGNDVTQSLSALGGGFLSVFTLVAASKLYLALTHHSAAGSASEE